MPLSAWGQLFKAGLALTQSLTRCFCCCMSTHSILFHEDFFAFLQRSLHERRQHTKRGKSLGKVSKVGRSRYQYPPVIPKSIRTNLSLFPSMFVDPEGDRDILVAVILKVVGEGTQFNTHVSCLNCKAGIVSRKLYYCSKKRW